MNMFSFSGSQSPACHYTGMLIVGVLPLGWMCVCRRCSEGSHLARPGLDNGVFVVPASFPKWPSHAATMVP